MLIMQKIQEQKDNEYIRLLEDIYQYEFYKSCFDDYKEITFIKKLDIFFVFQGVDYNHIKEVILLFDESDKKSILDLDGWDMRSYAADISVLKDNLHDDDIVVPEVNWQRTGQNIVVYEYYEGVAIKDVTPVEKKLAVPKIIELWYNMVFRDGFVFDLWTSENFLYKGNRVILNMFGRFYKMHISDRIHIAKQIIENQDNDVYNKICNLIFKLVPDIDVNEKITPKLETYIERTKSEKKDFVEFNGEKILLSKSKDNSIFDKKVTYTTLLSETIFGSESGDMPYFYTKTRFSLLVLIIILIIAITLVLI